MVKTLLPMQVQVPPLVRELDHTFCAAQPKRIFFFYLFKCVIKYIILKTVVRSIQNCLDNKWINITSKRPSKGQVSHTPERLMLINPGSASFKSLGFSYLLLPRKLSQNPVDEAIIILSYLIIFLVRKSSS